MRKALVNWNAGISVGGARINNLRYADDTVQLANGREELEQLMGKMKDDSSNYRLEIDHNKTNVMIIDRRNNNWPDIGLTEIGQYQVVNRFIYLGIRNEEIRHRCEMAKMSTRMLHKG